MDHLVIIYFAVVLLPAALLMLYVTYHYAWMIYIARGFQKVAYKYGLNYTPPSLFLYPSVAGRYKELGLHLTIVKKNGKRRVSIKIFSSDDNIIQETFNPGFHIQKTINSIIDRNSAKLL